MKTAGTKQYADTTENFFYGCSNNCEKYCYAKRIFDRFIESRLKNLKENEKIIDITTDWSVMMPNIRSLAKGYSKRDGRIMTPSSHDITDDLINLKPMAAKLEELAADGKISKSGYRKLNKLIEDKIYENGGYMHVYELCAWKFEEMLKAGNSLLITTKPKFEIIEYLCDYLEEYKKQIQFRFTITSINDSILKYWEGGAPRFGDRLASLVHAFSRGYKTSISIEPYLDKNPMYLINILAPYVSGSIWLGIMTGKIYPFHSKELIKKMIDSFEELDEEVQDKIRLKDTLNNMGFYYGKQQKKDISRSDLIDVKRE